MTNKEMEQVQNTITLLTTLQDYAIHNDTFMDDTGITICSITKCINSLREIHLKEAIIKARCNTGNIAGNAKDVSQEQNTNTSITKEEKREKEVKNNEQKLQTHTDQQK